MKGNITKRGKNSWRLKFDAGRDEKGERKTQFVTFRGTKREAQVELAKLIASVAEQKYVEPHKITVAEWVRGRVDHWEASGEISARTAQRYRQLVENQIAPHIGAKLLQKLRTIDIETWHTTLRTSGRVRGKGEISARTIGHAHRVLGKATRDAVKNELVLKNVVALESAPKVDDGEMEIVQDVPAFVAKVRGHRLFAMGMIGLFTGMRLGEVLALRWGRVDLDGKVIQVREALEATKAHGIRFKVPKSKAGRRDLTLPDILVDALRDFRREQLELRLKLGSGKLPDDGLLFPNIEGEPRSPSSASRAWGDATGVGYHALRHTHASQLIHADVDIVTISKRLGHASPAITLAVYAHMFKKTDAKAAAAINAAMG
ncbi:site-specific integrase [Bradyrhizobium barranii]|uniref:Site-specific integrase n=1 Tax=Bradyrhizobium barranii TaxID=2992140 RepID=A0ABY3QAR2_9BRAD|nr:site-specific integrase [Bradyrhizobium japonicum]UFW82858.1 site-specific integrase [Bradyrhizobium japonicum]